MEAVIALTNGLRAWGAASVLMAAPVLVPATVNAFIGAWLASRNAWRVNRTWRWSHAIRAFCIALWHEGWVDHARVNLWVTVLLMVFLALAGSGIFIASNLSGLGYYDPRLTAVMFFAWGGLSLAGWIFAISTAQSGPNMGMASGLLLATFTALALQMKGFV